MNFARAFIYSKLSRLGVLASEVLSSWANGSKLAALEGDLARLLQHTSADLIALSRKIAAKVSRAGKDIV
jgi:hypothetical protein